MKMTAAVLYEQGLPRPYADSLPLKLETVDLEGPGEGEVLVKVAGAGLCHSDLSTIDNSRPRTLPAVLGHEGAGIVAEVGRGIADLKSRRPRGVHLRGELRCLPQLRARQAQRLPALARDAQPRRAADRRPRLSRNGKPIAHYSGISCFAEYAVVARSSLVKIDPKVPLTDAAMFGCAVQTGVGAAVNTAHVRPGDVVAVDRSRRRRPQLHAGRAHGRRPAHHCRRSLRREAGARAPARRHRHLQRRRSRLRRGDPSGDRRRRRLRLRDGGLHQGPGTRHRHARHAAARSSRAGLSPATATYPLDHSSLVGDEKSIRGCYMGSCVPERDVPVFIELYKQGRLPIDRLKSGTLPLADINAGFDRLADVAAVRQIVVFD